MGQREIKRKENALEGIGWKDNKMVCWSFYNFIVVLRVGHNFQEAIIELNHGFLSKNF